MMPNREFPNVLEPHNDLAQDIPAEQQITKNSDFRKGDEVELAGLMYRVHMVTTKGLVLRAVK